MKKVVLLIVICLSAWGYYQKEHLQQPSIAVEQSALDDNSSQPNQAALDDNSIENNQAALDDNSMQNDQELSEQTETRFQCDGRQYCSQMNSREEAEYFLRNCPNTKMDGDHDGVPCENDTRF